MDVIDNRGVIACPKCKKKVALVEGSNKIKWRKIPQKMIDLHMMSDDQYCPASLVKIEK